MSIDTYPHRTRNLVIGWVTVAALVVAVAWPPGIAMDLMMTVMTVVELFGGPDVLGFERGWGATALRALGVAAMIWIAWRLLRYQRISKFACGRCGRDDSPVRDRRRLAKAAAWWSIVPACGYGALKLYWGFGGAIGLAEADVFGDVKPWSPGFGDTAVLAAIGVVIALAMAFRWNLPRWLLLTPALIGCAMLLPVAVFGTVGNIVRLNDSGPIAGLQPWVPWFVYGCFLVWGAGLAIVTVEYLYGARGGCRVCGRG